MSKSSKHFQPKKPSITPAQHARVREQLTEILKQIAAGQLDRVASPITQLVRKYPALAEVNHVASGFYSQTGKRDQAFYYAQRAAEIDPTIAEYHSALGTLNVQAGEHKQAVVHLQRAFEINPDFHQALGTLGVSYMAIGQIAKAKRTLDQSIERFPDDPEAMMNRALLESDIANAHNAVELMHKAIARFPDNPILHDSIAMFSCYDDQLTPEQVYEIHQAFGRCVQSRVRTPRSYPNTPEPTKRIRVGFVSSDFKTHSIAYFIEPIFEHIDHNRFELCVYHTSTHIDSMTSKLKAHADLWRSCTSGIAATHKQIVQDRVDILIELNGHFASNALPIFAAKPAPVSVSMIGYANTTGLESITARLVDAITDPEPSADRFATEQLVRVEDCFLCYRPPKDLPAIEPSTNTRPFTFGSFNDLRKMSPSTLRTWATILKENPETQLVLKTSRLAEQEVCDDLNSRFESLGVEPSRIKLLGRTPTTRDHLALYNTIDCSLDTFPYTGTTTTCESLAMGVPMLTLMGNAHAGRVSASLLCAIGRSDLVAPDEQAYIDLATKHAQAGLRSLEDRQTLQSQLNNSVLTDEAGYTKKIESIFASLWKTWCDKHTNTESRQ